MGKNRALLGLTFKVCWRTWETGPLTLMPHTSEIWDKGQRADGWLWASEEPRAHSRMRSLRGRHKFRGHDKGAINFHFPPHSQKPWRRRLFYDREEMGKLAPSIRHHARNLEKTASEVWASSQGSSAGFKQTPRHTRAEDIWDRVAAQLLPS